MTFWYPLSNPNNTHWREVLSKTCYLNWTFYTKLKCELHNLGQAIHGIVNETELLWSKGLDRHNK